MKMEFLTKYSDLPATIVDDDNSILWCSFNQVNFDALPIFPYVKDLEIKEGLPKLLIFNRIEIHGLFRIGSYRFFIGPAITAKPLTEIHYALLSASNCSQEISLDTIRNIPFVSICKFIQYLSLLCFTIDGKKYRTEDILQNKINVDTPAFDNLRSDFLPDDADRPGLIPQSNPDLREISEIYNSIKAGNEEEVAKLIIDSSLAAKFKIASKKENSAILGAAATLLAKAAFDAGVGFDDIYVVIYSFIKYSGEIEDFTDYQVLLTNMAKTFAMRVKEERQRQKYSLPIQKAINYIESHLHYSINLADVANHVNLSRAYFSQYFSKQTGMTLQKCILKMKIHESENMLRYTHQSVGEISTSLAFCSQSYFTEVFKKINGMTPADFRKRYKQSIKSE